MCPSNRLFIHHFEPASRSNGPGWRAVIWFQGCTLACPGCFNPATHPRHGGREITIYDLASMVLSIDKNIEGITISGGEPLQQIENLVHFLEFLRKKTDLSVIVFSGYAWPEIQSMPVSHRLFAVVDVLIAGRYNSAYRNAHGLLGSRNKTIHFLTNRYSPNDLSDVPEAEIIVNLNGEIIFSGIDPYQ